MVETAHSQPAALITGATGYLGLRLAARLRSEGFAIHAITRASSSPEKLEPLGDEVTVHRHDGTTGRLIEIVATAKPLIAFHLAGLFIAPHKPGDVVPLLESNVVFGTQLLEALSLAGVRSIVNVGTWWQHYGDQPYCPVNLYAATRQAFQDIVEAYTESTPMRAITLKIFETYGEDDPRQKLFSLLARLAVEKKPLDMSPGDQPIDYVHIDDVIEAFVMAGRRLSDGLATGHEKYAVSTRQAVKLKELVHLFGEAVGRPLPVVWGARPHRLREMMVMCRAGEWLPGWTPQVDLVEGIRRFVAARGLK